MALPLFSAIIHLFQGKFIMDTFQTEFINDTEDQPVIQTVSKFKNLKKIDSYFPFKAKIRAKWYLRYPFVVKIMYLYPISKSGTLLRHSLIASKARQFHPCVIAGKARQSLRKNKFFYEIATSLRSSQ